MRAVCTTAEALGLVVVGLGVTGCADSRLTLANYDRIQDGMSLSQIEPVRLPPLYLAGVLP